MSFREEFPSYPPLSLPEIPSTWEDTSWHNDMCPSWCTPDRGLQVFVDYLDPSMRAFPETVRFTVVDSEGNEVAATDDWSEVLKACE